eukprot:6492024-Amphidinium_carterae.1
MAWVRNEYDQRKGMVTTLCDWRNSDVDSVFRLQKEKDHAMSAAMNEIYAEQLKKRWMGQNAVLQAGSRKPECCNQFDVLQVRGGHREGTPQVLLQGQSSQTRDYLPSHGVEVAELAQAYSALLGCSEEIWPI